MEILNKLRTIIRVAGKYMMGIIITKRQIGVNYNLSMNQQRETKIMKQNCFKKVFQR